MKQYEVLLIDDEEKLREVLKIKIEDYCSGFSVVGEAGSVNEAVSFLQKNAVDIVLLDIAMPGDSGLELFNKIAEINFEVVFVTGYHEYALNALKLSAVDYLLKPVRTEELLSALEKASKQIRDKDNLERYNVLVHNMNHVGDQETKIAIPGSEAFDFIRVGDIVRCEGWEKYTRIILNTGDIIVSSYNIGVFKPMLLEYGFFSSHKSHLVNTLMVKRYRKDGTIVMSDDSEVPLARRRKDDFQNYIMSKTLRIN